jgi:hypothetical protein
LRHSNGFASLLKHCLLLLATTPTCHVPKLSRFAAAALHAVSCEDVAKEVVALLRQRGSYNPPSDGRRLRALQHQLDFLGLPGPAAVNGQEVLLVPGYIIGVDAHVLEDLNPSDGLRVAFG